MTITELAHSLGATDPCDNGINWTWSNGFPTRESAEQFCKALDERGYEHRGVYPRDNVWDVRWRA